ncbi:uncharacterized protein LOC112541408 isoform X1 [Python bivittatus]|uniref:Uncharacterized protein LOC112541408 isoform X1 n=1 Tax=Python bivittatus TaxID=176946 RepID=A0A9F5IVD4_PYTBI|nr:uncharacterized protein LOC112541408 isoform X1 [Python bivittatus]
MLGSQPPSGTLFCTQRTSCNRKASQLHHGSENIFCFRLGVFWAPLSSHQPERQARQRHVAFPTGLLGGCFQSHNAVHEEDAREQGMVFPLRLPTPLCCHTGLRRISPPSLLPSPGRGATVAAQERSCSTAMELAQVLPLPGGAQRSQPGKADPDGSLCTCRLGSWPRSSCGLQLLHDVSVPGLARISFQQAQPSLLRGEETPAFPIL